MAPNMVTAENTKRVFQNMFPPLKTYKNKFELGDQVRISKVKHTFDKGYLPNWTDEVFFISKIVKRIPIVYKIKDYEGKELDGTFYAEELQHIKKSDAALWSVEKVISERGKGKRRQLLVKWVGFSDIHNSWISANELVNLNNDKI